MYPPGWVMPNMLMAVTTAADAPPLTPSRWGSASGLRVADCITAPAAPSALPTNRPSTVRGTRPPRTTSMASCSWPSSPAHTCAGLSGFAPTARLARHARTTAKIPMTTVDTDNIVPPTRVRRGARDGAGGAVGEEDTRLQYEKSMVCLT